MITINLSDLPPSTNGLFANLPGKGRVKTERYRTWLNAAGWQIKAQRPGRIAGEVSLAIAMKRPRANADLSNRIKALEDLLVEHQVIDDDQHVVSLTVRWREEPGCMVTVSAA